jgi:hypothetical protein
MSWIDTLALSSVVDNGERLSRVRAPDIIDHGYPPEYLAVVGQIRAVVVLHWRHVLLKPGKTIEITGGHRGVFVKEISREEFENRVRAVGALEWLEPPQGVYFWEVAWD